MDSNIGLNKGFSGLKPLIERVKPVIMMEPVTEQHIVSGSRTMVQMAADAAPAVFQRRANWFSSFGMGFCRAIGLCCDLFDF